MRKAGDVCFAEVSRDSEGAYFLALLNINFLYFLGYYKSIIYNVIYRGLIYEDFCLI